MNTYHLTRILVLIFVIFYRGLLFGQSVTTLTTGFNANGGIAIDSTGVIYVADFGSVLGNPRGADVYKVLRDGSFSVFATGFVGASGNAFDSQGNLFQSNIAVGTISKVTPAGDVSTFATANITSPVGVAVDNQDNIFVTNCRTPGWITKITPEGQSSILVTSNLMSCPNGLTIDNAGNLYTCNFGNGNVIKITPAGVASILAFVPGNNNGHLIFANNVLYVVGRQANQIFTVTLSGQVSKLAGAGTPGFGSRGKTDGPADQATFSLPNGIGASPDGDTLYVSDKVAVFGTALNPSVIRMITGVKQLTHVEDHSSRLPEAFILNQNYPNPFNPKTTITYELPQAEHVEIVVFNIFGQKVKTLVSEEQQSGYHSAVWDGTNSIGVMGGSGVYYYKVTAGEHIASGKMTLMK